MIVLIAFSFERIAVIFLKRNCTFTMSGSARASESAADIHECVSASVDQLASLWDQMGIVGDQRAARYGVVLKHVRGLMEDMVQEETALRDRLVANVDRLHNEVTQLCTELHLPPYEAESGLTVIQSEKQLRLCVETLNKDKQERLKAMKSRMRVDQHLCDALNAIPYYIPTGSVPSDLQLHELEQHIRDLEAEQSKRMKQLATTRQNIARLLCELELSPNTSFEHDVVYDPESVSVTADSMRAVKRYNDELERLKSENTATVAMLTSHLQSLWDRVDVSQEDRSQFLAVNSGVSQRVVHSMKDEIRRCELLKRQTVEREVCKARTELTELWDKCYISPEQRAAFSPFHHGDMTEELLEQHKAEILRLKDSFEKYKDMYDKLARRQKLWDEYLDLEHRANNPERYFNRGGNLLKEEKERKKLIAELPKLEQEVLLHIKQWERDTGQTFRISGLQFEPYVKKQHDDFAAEKENEKLLRHQQKAKRMEEEILYGSKPVTPGPKRFASNTPSKTPNSKVRKATEAPKTPSGSRALFASASPAVASRDKLTPAGVKHVANDWLKKPLSEKHHTNSAAVLTTIPPASTAAVASDANVSTFSLVSVGPYEDFAKGLSGATRPNCSEKVAYF